MFLERSDELDKRIEIVIIVPDMPDFTPNS